MKLFFITTMICMMSQTFCAESIRTIPWDLVPKILSFGPKIDEYAIPMNIYQDREYIDVKRILALRLVCSTANQKIIETINEHTPYLQQFYIYIQYKKRGNLLKEEAVFLNRFPNLRTKLTPEISGVYVYLFYQKFSFCTTDKSYAGLYEKQRAITCEGLKLFDESFPRNSFSINTMLKYGWCNHGLNAAKTGRVCNFSQIGFLFFDLWFFPPSEFWSEPYHPDTINPVNVLTSISFNKFFQKALCSFLKKIPEYCKIEIIEPVMQMSPLETSLSVNYDKYFYNFTVPLLKKRLQDDYELFAIKNTKPDLKKALKNINKKASSKPKKPSSILKKLKVMFKKWKLLICTGTFIGVVYLFFKFFEIDYT